MLASRGSTRPTRPQSSCTSRRVARTQPVHRRCPLLVRAVQSSPTPPGSKPVKSPAEQRTDMIKGCKTVLMELQGLDFGRTDVRGYVTYVVKPPREAPAGFELSRCKVVVEQLLDGKEEAVTDVEALKVAQAMLSDVWRWRRRGGGMEDETDRPPYAIALENLQNIEPEQIDRITSSLLDSLPITEAQKREMSGSVQTAAIAGIQGGVWGSLVLCLLFLLVFNFARGG